MQRKGATTVYKRIAGKLFGGNKVYFIRRSVWWMPEIEFQEELAVLELLKKVNAVNGSDKPLGETLEEWHKQNLIGSILALSLKPYNRGIVRLWNKYWIWKNTVTPDTLAHGMTRPQWGEIAADFFMQNNAGMASSHGIESNSALSVSQKEFSFCGTSSANPSRMQVLPLIALGTISSSIYATNASNSEQRPPEQVPS